MKRIVVIAAAALFVWPIPASPVPRMGMCLCQFVAPTYSRLARTAGWQGKVLVRVRYNSDGIPSTVDVPGPTLDSRASFRDAAVSAVKQWRFCRAAGSNKELTVTVNFRLKGGPTREVDEWSPTEVSFEPPATVTITATAPRVMVH
jgi:TonB family protein